MFGAAPESLRPGGLSAILSITQARSLLYASGKGRSEKLFCRFWPGRLFSAEILDGASELGNHNLSFVIGDVGNGGEIIVT